MLVSLKLKIIETFGHRYVAARELGIDKARLSKILHERQKPTERELEAFRLKLGASDVSKIFARSNRRPAPDRAGE